MPRAAVSSRGIDTTYTANMQRFHPRPENNRTARNPMPQISPFAMKTRFIAGSQPSEPAAGSWWFIFAKTRILINPNRNMSATICAKSPEQLGLDPVFSRYLGKYGDVDCFVATLDGDPPATPPDMEFRDLRSLYGEIDDDIFCLAGRAIQISHWQREQRFCGRCGTAMIDRRSELARRCPGCDFISYPRLSPAVIMSVIRGEQILLARAPRFPPAMYSTLAGFVEPGETLEEAVCREVFEEVAIVVDNVRYVASQPWPFPHSLMIGFTSTYKSGEIEIDHKELEAAGWFSRAALPALPSKISISRLLIDRFIEGVDGG